MRLTCLNLPSFFFLPKGWWSLTALRLLWLKLRKMFKRERDRKVIRSKEMRIKEPCLSLEKCNLLQAAVQFSSWSSFWGAWSQNATSSGELQRVLWVFPGLAEHWGWTMLEPGVCHWSGWPFPSPGQLQRQLQGQDGAGQRQGWMQRSRSCAGGEPGLKPKFDTAELEKVAEQLDQETLPIYFCLLERSCIKQGFLLPPMLQELHSLVIVDIYFILR